MSDCYLIKSGKQFALSFSSDVTEDIQATNICLKALNELMPCVQPISVEFRLRCQNKENYSYELNIQPPIYLWHIQKLPIPPKIIIDPSPIAHTTQVPDITIDILSNWFQTALQQECPYPKTHQLCWTEIQIWATRARVLDETYFKQRQSFLLETAIGNFEYPVEHRHDGIWVYGPIASFRSEPPFTLQFLTWYGFLKLNIFVHWSMWYDVNSPGYTALKQAICRIVDQGWELSEHTPLSDPEIV
jgi:hypothetical protein